jgi:hypothetical protein
MPGIVGQGTTFNLPNFVGPLFAASPEDTPFLSAIGGLTGGRATPSTVFTWSGYDLRDADDRRQRLEGANAPNAEARTRYADRNVVEIHQEAVETSYTKMATSGQLAGSGSSHPNAGSQVGANAVPDEHTWQLMQQIKQVARDVEKTFISGRFQEPSDNATPRRTRGMIQATQTNVNTLGAVVGAGDLPIAANGTITSASHGLADGTAVTVRALAGGAIGVLDAEQLYYVRSSQANTFELSRAPGGAAITFAATGTADVATTVELTEGHILDIMQRAWENGGLQESETRTIMANAGLRRKLTNIFITAKNYREESRSVGGVSLQTIQTDFGTTNIVMSRYIPTGCVLIASMEECAPRFLEIPGKGHFFVEPLAKVGAAERDQLYGEIGLEYGNERRHARLVGVR